MPLDESVINTTTNADARMVSVLAQLVHEQLVSQADLRAVARYHGSITGSGSNAVKIAQASYGADLMAAMADETVEVADTALTTASTTITVVRHALRRDITDLFNMGGRPSDLKLESLAKDIALGARRKFNFDLETLFASLASSAGTASTALTVDDVYDALGLLRTSNVMGGSIAMVLHPTQYNNFVESLRGEGQAIFPPDSASMLGLSSIPGFQGRWNGVDVIISGEVGAGTGAIFDTSCFGWADGLPDLSRMGGVAAPVDGSIFIELQRDASRGTTEVVGNFYYGVAEVEDLRGVKIVSGL